MVHVLRLAAWNPSSSCKLLSAIRVFQKLEKTYYSFSSKFYLSCLPLLFPQQAGAFHFSYHSLCYHSWNDRMERFCKHFFVLEQPEKTFTRLLDIFLVA